MTAGSLLVDRFSIEMPAKMSWTSICGSSDAGS